MNYNLLINNTQPSLAISYTGGDYRVEIRANLGGAGHGGGGTIAKCLFRCKAITKASVFFVLRSPKFMQSLIKDR